MMMMMMMLMNVIIMMATDGFETASMMKQTWKMYERR